MQTIDWLIILAYFCLIGGLVWWVVRKNQNTADDYFLAGRNLGWFVIGASIFASNIGSEHLVGLAGSGATFGVAYAHFELHAWCLLVLGWVLAPFYLRSRVFTMPEFLERRFSPTARLVLSIISLLAYIITKIAVGIFAGGVVFGTLLPDLHFMGLNSFWVGSIAVVVLTGIYTVAGGMRAVAYTETLQTVVLVCGSALVTFYGLHALGGWHMLRETLGPEMFNLWRPLLPEGVQGTWAPVMEHNAAGEVTKMAWYFNGNFPWVGMLFAAPIVGLWYWCTDQYIVQRALGARSETEARRGTIWAALLKLLPVFIFIIPGMICLALAQSGEVQALREVILNEDGTVNDLQAQAAFPLMVQHVLPAGVRGIVVAGLLSALMSSMAGVFNACSTLFTIDLYGKIRPHASQANLVWVGRVATSVMVIIGLLWIPVIQGAKGLYAYLQGVQSYLAPPIFVVFFLGIFWKRLNAKGCLAALLVGFALGLIRLAVDTPVSLSDHTYAEGSLLWIINNVYFQYYALFIFIVSAAAMIGVSLATSAPPPEKIRGLTMGSVSDEDRAGSRNSWDWRDVCASALVIALILAAYIYFSG
jgi:SSS family solute:Na+ symporter